MNSKFFSFRTLSCLLFVGALLSTVVTRSQTTNPCGVKAVIWPATSDTVVPANTPILLSAHGSVNATSYQWLGNNIFTGNTMPEYIYGVNAGYHNMSLVASNGICSDTASILIFSAGTPHSVDSMQLSNYGYSGTSEYGTCIDATPDGGFVMGGYSNRRLCGSTGLVVKLKDKGCIEWSKAFRRPYECDYIEFSDICAASDTSYYALEKYGDLYKLDKYGNLVWIKDWGVTGFGEQIGFSQITADTKGNIYALAASAKGGWVVAKIDSSGSILWNRYYRIGQYNPFDLSGSDWSIVRGAVWKNDKLYVTGQNTIRKGGRKSYNFVVRLDALTGTTDWQYGYSDEANGPDQSLMEFAEPSAYKDQLLVAGYNQGQWATIIDTSGVFRKSIRANFRNTYGPVVTKAAADRSGNIYMLQWERQTLPLQPFFAYETKIVRVDTAMNKQWGFYYSTYTRGYFTDAVINNKQAFAAIGNDVGKANDGMFASMDFRYLRVDTPGVFSSVECNYTTTDYTLTAHQLKRIDFQWEADSITHITPSIAWPAAATDAYVQSRYTCPDFIDSCSVLKLNGPKALCSLKETYTYSILRNRKCVLTPKWAVPEGVTLVRQTDTTITVRFGSMGRFVIAASLQGCVPAADSIVVQVSSRSSALNLGKDTTICANTTFRLHAGNDFLRYTWQDSSTDSVFTVTKAGTYWVHAIDSCGNLLADTIRIGAYHPVVSAGPDRTKCNQDTLRLDAPPGYLSYLWSNDYNISNLAAPAVVVNPLVDTAYLLRAEVSPGCFAFDTIRVKVYHSRPVSLGPDLRFCKGDSVLLDAGAGFRSYVWGSGQTTQQLFAQMPGVYTVTGITANGCRSADTIEVLQPYELPKVRLDKTESLCFGESRLLSAGDFAAYQWSTGAISAAISISDTGRYSVVVTDANGCKGSDTAIVKRINPLPARFLPADTAVCTYASLELKPDADYSRYLWSTGAGTKTLTVKLPGIYWLAVTDNRGCTGRDTVLVKSKNCMYGFYAPTAFTPNRDGKNDVFKPLIFGVLQQYEFTVYNRWGEVVFRSTDAGLGWNGKVAGMIPDSGVFVWTCKYQLEGSSLQMEKGAVMLMQ